MLVVPWLVFLSQFVMAYALRVRLAIKPTYDQLPDTCISSTGVCTLVDRAILVR